MNLMRPVMAWAVLAFTMTLLITLYLFPLGNHTKRALLFDVARANTTSGIEAKVFYDHIKNLTLYVDHISPAGEMRGLFVMNTLPGGAVNIITAESGGFVQSTEEMTLRLMLRDGKIHNEDEETGAYHIVTFATYTISLDLVGSSPVRSIEGTPKELFVKELMERIDRDRSLGIDVNPLVVDLHNRFALPASVFIFAMLAVPLGIQKVRSAGLTGFTVSVGVFLIYYTFMKSFEALGDNGRMNPIAATWATDIILGTIGAVILYRASKEKPPMVVPFFENLVHNTLGRFGLGTHKQDKREEEK